MAKDGIDMSAGRPTLLSDAAVGSSDVVITMGCGRPPSVAPAGGVPDDAAMTPAPVPAQPTAGDLGLILGVALMWGSSFLLIEIGLDDFPPATVAWLRIAFGALALALLPAARARLSLDPPM